MKNRITLILLFLTFAVYSQQKLIVVQNVTSSVFEDINEAIAATNPGDTIYLPGGTFNVYSITIDKPLNWVGVGHNPNSTLATGTTQINGNIYFSGNCDNSTITGIYFYDKIYFGSTNGNEAENIVISRCHFRTSLYLRRSNVGNPILNTKITESILQMPIYAQNGSQLYLTKNFIGNNYIFLIDFNQSIFKHNILVGSTSTSLRSNLNNCLFENNIIFSNILSKCHFGQFLNNAFSINYTFPYGDNNTGNGNIYIPSNEIENTFQLLTGSYMHYSYENDYHLKEGSPAIGAATDGTDLGIYGSPVPYKEGAVPFNPHIRSVNMPLHITEGQLPVEISVGAQSR